MGRNRIFDFCEVADAASEVVRPRDRARWKAVNEVYQLYFMVKVAIGLRLGATVILSLILLQSPEISLEQNFVVYPHFAAENRVT